MGNMKSLVPLIDRLWIGETRASTYAPVQRGFDHCESDTWQRASEMTITFIYFVCVWN